jgi:hypothetical protein
MPNLRTDLLVDLAWILLARGDQTGAAPVIADAIEISRAQGESRIHRPSPFVGRLSRLSSSKGLTEWAAHKNDLSALQAAWTARRPEARSLPTFGPGASAVSSSSAGDADFLE